MEIRLLTGADADAWRILPLEALEREPEAFSSSAEEHRKLSAEEVKSRLALDPEQRFVVGAFDDDELAGVAGFYRETGLKSLHKGRIWGVYLTERLLRGRGIGRNIMEALLERAERLPGIEQIQLSVTTQQTSAVKLYLALGFEPFGREPKALKIGDRYFDEDSMVLWLPRKSAALKAR
jgi:RimJ/RimL family protein N-acetyltransferase